MAAISIEHIEVDPHGVARIVGRRTKVAQIVMDKRANGWTPEEIQAQYPHLSLAEVHAAFAYYHDHQTEVDAQIAQSLREAEALRDEAGESLVVKKLRGLGKLP